MTQITERPIDSVFPTPNLLEATASLITAMKHSDIPTGADLLGQLALLISDPHADRAATMALFFRNNAGGRDTLGSLFYGSGEEDENGPIVAPAESRVMNRDYRTALIRLHAALDALIPADNSTMDEKRDFWEDVKVHLAPGQVMDDGQVSEVTSADLNTVLKAHYGAGRVKKLKAYTDNPDSLNYVLFQPRTVEGTKLEIRDSMRLNGEQPPVGALSLRTMNGVVHFV